MNVFRKEEINMPKIIEDLENRILKAARKRLLGGDLSSFSARAIADDCGIAVGTIYNYSRDLDSLLAAVMAEDWIEEMNRAGVAAESAASFEEGICLLYGAIHRFSLQYENVWQSYPSGKSFSIRYRHLHRILREQILEHVKKLNERFDRQMSEGRMNMLAVLIISAAQEMAVTEEDFVSFILDIL